MNNLQVMNKSGSGAAVDLMMKTFTAPKKGGAFDFANTFESKVNDTQAYDSFSVTNNDSYSDQFSFENQNSYEPVRYEEPAPRKEEPVAKKEEVKPREQDDRPEKEENVEEKPVEDRAKEDDNNNDDSVSEKKDDSEKKSDDKDTDDDKSDGENEAKKDESKDDEATSEEDKAEEKVAKQVEVDELDLKTVDTTDKVEVKETVSTDVTLKETESKDTQAVETENSEVTKTETEEVTVETNKVVADQGVAVQKKVEEDIETAEEEISTKASAADQSKLEAVQIKQSDLNKNNDQAGAKKFVQKRDMMEQLEKETGVKIDKMSVEKVKTSPDEVAQKTSKDLLKSLDSNRGRFDMQNAKAARTGEGDIKEALITDRPEQKLNKLDIAKNLIKNSAPQTKAEVQNTNSNDSSNSFANTMKEQSPMERATKTMQQAQTGHSPNLRNMNNVQEIMNSLKTMLRGADLQANTKLNLDFQTQALGQMRMGVQHKSDGIDVSIEVGSDSSRQELMKQKDELSEQLRNMGYKHVNVDISYGEHQQHHDAQQQQMSGNEDIRNVKLAGDDDADLSEILNMA